MKKLPALILFIFLFFFVSLKSTSAATLFEDNFEDGNADGWRVVPKREFTEPAQQPVDTPWEIKDFDGNFRYGKTLGTQQQRSISIPEIPASELSKWKNYTFEVDMFPSAYDRNLLFRYQDPLHGYGLHLIPGGVYLVRYRPGKAYGEDIAFHSKWLGYSSQYHIKIVVNENNIKVFVDSDEPLIDFSDTTDHKIPQGIIGLYLTTGASYPHTVFFDNITVSTLEPELQPIILLPGFGASWNHEAMILGATDKKPEDFYMTPGVKTYDGLIQTFKNAGYETEGANKSLFVFNYDWTKSVGSIANDLKDFVNNTVDPPEGAEIDLVGHSMGGLVARTYVQNNPDSPVDQLITLGSPHKGMVKAYYLWEGGNLHQSLPAWQRIASGLLFQVRKPGYASVVDTVHSIFPSIKDFLPVFPYLKENGSEKPLEGMQEKNNWLVNLNSSLPNHLLSVLTTVTGNSSNSTTRWIKIEDRDWLDEVMNLWPDGKPTGEEELAAGDSTILTESSQINTNNITLENINHRGLVEEEQAQEKLMELLGLSPSSISTSSTAFSYEPALVFQIASPANIAVYDQNNNPVGFGDNKMIVVLGATTQEYKIKVTGTVSGQYELYIGQILSNDDLWTTIAGTINQGEEVTYQVNFNSGSPSPNPVLDQTGEIFPKSARAKLLSLKDYVSLENIDNNSKRSILSSANQIIRSLDKGQFEKSITDLYDLRYNLYSYQSRGRLGDTHTQMIKDKVMKIVADLETAYITSATGSYNSSKLEREFYLAEKYFNSMEQNVKNLASRGNAQKPHGQLYSQASGKLNLAKESSSFEAHIKALGAKYLSLEGGRFIR